MLNQNNGFSNYSSQKNYNKNGVQKPQQTIQPINPEALPEDYVKAAEEVIGKIKNSDTDPITTSKIRNLLSIVSDIYNAENIRSDSEITQESQNMLNMLHIRIVYEAGREKSVKRFVEEAKLLNYLKDIGKSREKLINYSHYMEALVAYHKFYINKER